MPVPLITTVFLKDETRKLSELELKAEVEQLVEQLRAKGAHVYVPRQDLDYAVHVGLRTLTLRRLVENNDGLYSARSGETAVLRYYANSIAHLI